MREDETGLRGQGDEDREVRTGSEDMERRTGSGEVTGRGQEVEGRKMRTGDG